jgi:hypothetical protein
MLTLAQKKKFVKDLLKSVTEDVVKATESMPAEWDGIELRTYIAAKLEDPITTYAMRGNTARGRAYAAEIANNRAL